MTTQMKKTAADNAKPAKDNKSAKPAKEKKPANAGGGGKTAVLVVRGPAKGRWRARRKFGPQPVIIPLDELTEDEIVALKDDPALMVTEEQR
jgi:hypothetical protein